MLDTSALIRQLDGPGPRIRIRQTRRTLDTRLLIKKNSGGNANQPSALSACHIHATRQGARRPTTVTRVLHAEDSTRRNGNPKRPPHQRPGIESGKELRVRGTVIRRPTLRSDLSGYFGRTLMPRTGSSVAEMTRDLAAAGWSVGNREPC
jgi:hypothetical protein